MSLTRAIGRTGLLFGFITCLAAAGSAQQDGVLTLEQALKLARERNGAVMAAQFDVEAARQRVNQARSAFLPTITPSYRYNSGRTQIDTGTGTQFLQNEGGSSLVRADWRLFDSGERMFSMRASRSSLAAQEFSTQQTLRSTLFSVTQQYYEALRSQELLKVAEAQVTRTLDIKNQILARIEAKDAADVERYQAEADYQNARVRALVAKNEVSNSAATLKGTIGLDATQPLPGLVAEAQITEVKITDDLKSLYTEGLTNRADLQARRESLDSLGFSRARARREAGLSFGLDARFDQHVTPRSLEDRALTLNLSYPLFDGGQRRAVVRELDQNIQADRAALVQAERTVRAEIEAAFAAFDQNGDRLEAAKVAVEAARKNFEAADASQKAGAYDLLQVSAAQLSLVTAESNYIEAIYDYRISEARLQLVTGRPVPGEK
jgi:outer membrane protein